MAVTNAWDESTPLGTEDASVLDNYARQHRLDLGERLESMFYGFNADSNSDPENVYGCKHLKLYPQSSPNAVANYGFLYGKDVSSVNQLHWLPETGQGSERQLTKGSGALNVVAGDYAANSVDEDDIRLANNAALTSRNQAGDGDINGYKVNASDVPEILVGAVLSADTAPASDPAIANKKYVDDQITANKTAWEPASDVAHDNTAAPTTWTDLDLSSIVGSNKALVYLKVYSTTSQHRFYFRLNGETDDWTTHDQGGCAGVMVKNGGTAAGAVIVPCDANGKVEWYASSNAACTVTVLGYVKEV